jgi:anti-anti-sigma factor
MSGYHSFELCYLAAVYTNLLVTKQPLDLYFKPKPGGFKDGILRVSPDLLPKGSIRIESVTVDDKDYSDFDANGLTVKLPVTKDAVVIKVRLVPTQGLEHFSARLNISKGVATLVLTKVRLVPTQGLEHFSARLNISKGVATLVLTGDLDHVALPFLMQKLDEVVQAQPERLVLKTGDLQQMTTAAARALIFAKQKMRTDQDVQISGANEGIKDLLNKTEFAESVSFTD